MLKSGKSFRWSLCHFKHLKALLLWAFRYNPGKGRVLQTNTLTHNKTTRPSILKIKSARDRVNIDNFSRKKNVG
jgi:hypothetical protein